MFDSLFFWTLVTKRKRNAFIESQFMRWWNLVKSHSLCHPTFMSFPCLIQKRPPVSPICTATNILLPKSHPPPGHTDLGLSRHPVATFDRWKAILGPNQYHHHQHHIPVNLKFLLPIFLVPPHTPWTPWKLRVIWYLQVFYIFLWIHFQNHHCLYFFAYYLGPCRKTLHNDGYIIEFPFIKKNP